MSMQNLKCKLQKPDPAPPQVTVLICTRNRDDLIQATIRSVLANTYPDFDLLIVDQSNEMRTTHAVSQFRDDPRLRYVSSNTSGLSRARNIGLSLITTDLVIMTDDDCEVPPNWIVEMVTPFQRHPQVGIVFCDVVAGPYDHEAGFIPVSLSSRALLIEDLAHWQTCDGVTIGIGAGMAVRRSTAEAIGGFEPLFGSGTRFHSGEDLDFTLRALIGGHQVYRLNHVSVVHHGFRTMQETRALIHQSMFSIGAIYGRLIRSGQWLATRNLIAIVSSLIVLPIIKSVRQRRIPPVLRRAIWLIRGLIEGLFLRSIRFK